MAGETTVWMRLDDGEPVEVEDEPRAIARRMVQGYRRVDAPVSEPGDERAGRGTVHAGTVPGSTDQPITDQRTED